MLSFFRRFTKSRFGLIVVFLFLGVIALAFGLGDITGMRNFGAATSAGVIAKVGDTEITGTEVRDRIERFLSDMRREGRQVTMEQFVAQGGLEQALDEMINNAAMVEFAKKNGMTVSKKLIDSEIASLPAFQGVDGKFSQKAYESMLAQQRISPQLLRDDLTRVRYASWLINPTLAVNQVPDKLLGPYASLLLERRLGSAGMVRTIDMDPGADPDDKTLTAYYNANRGRYMVAARRVIRWAPVKIEDVRATSAATDAEIAAAYKAAGTRFAAKEKRSVRQLVLLDQATANRVAGEAKGGKSLAELATGMGLEAGNFDGVEKADLARQTSAPIADAAFAAAQGGVVGPIRSPLGWAVLKVEKIEAVAPKSLDQARAELAAEVTTKKTVTKLSELRQQLEDGIGDGQTFDELVAEAKLTASRVGPVNAEGTNPDDPASKADPALAPVVRAGFIGEQGDEPQLAPSAREGSFALVAPERVIAAAPRPLAEIRDAVKRDYLVDEALKKARTVANGIVAKVNGGMPLAQALAEAGATKVPVKAFDMKRADLQKVKELPAHVTMAFSMAPKRAKLVPAPGRGGFVIVYLDKIEEHDASGDTALMDQMRGEISPSIGREHTAQFIEAIRRSIKVIKNDAAVAKLKGDLTGANQR